MNLSSPLPGGGRPASVPRREPGGGEADSPHPARFARDPPPPGEGGGVALVIPVLNEAETIGDVVRAVPREIVREIIVVDGGSTDETVAQARAAGARVIVAPRSG